MWSKERKRDIPRRIKGEREEAWHKRTVGEGGWSERGMNVRVDGVNADQIRSERKT